MHFVNCTHGFIADYEQSGRKSTQDIRRAKPFQTYDAALAAGDQYVKENCAGNAQWYCVLTPSLTSLDIRQFGKNKAPTESTQFYETDYADGLRAISERFYRIHPRSWLTSTDIENRVYERNNKTLIMRIGRRQRLMDPKLAAQALRTLREMRALEA